MLSSTKSTQSGKILLKRPFLLSVMKTKWAFPIKTKAHWTILMTSTGSTPLSRFLNFSASFHKIAKGHVASKIRDWVLIIVLSFLSDRGWLNFFLNIFFTNLSVCLGCNCLLFGIPQFLVTSCRILFEIPWFAYLAMYFVIFFRNLGTFFYNAGRIKISVRIKTRIGVARIIRFWWW